MIREIGLQRALRDELAYWKKRESTEYIDGVIRGLKIAYRCLEEEPRYKVESWLFKQHLKPLKNDLKTDVI